MEHQCFNVLGFAEPIVPQSGTMTFTKVTLEEVFSYFTVWTLHPLRRVCRTFDRIIKDSFDMRGKIDVDKKVLARSLASIVLYHEIRVEEDIRDTMHDLLWKHRKVPYMLRSFAYDSNDSMRRFAFYHIQLVYRRSSLSSKLYGWVGAIQIETHAKNDAGERKTSTAMDTLFSKKYEIVHRPTLRHIFFVSSDIIDVPLLLRNTHRPSE
jgi:hypothetical protein